MDKSTTIETNAVEVQAGRSASSKEQRAESCPGLAKEEKRKSARQENFAQKTKRPGLGLSPGTFVDQPSPKCCSTPI
jgi:hypothetical protein